MTQPPKIHLSLNTDGVVAPVLSAFKDCVQFVAIGLSAAQKLTDAEFPREYGWPLAFRFDDGPDAPDRRRQAFIAWLEQKAFHDLVKGVRGSLEEASIYAALVRNPPKVRSVEELQRELNAVRKRAASYSFPALMASVNQNLTTPLEFEAEFASLNRIRNCLEHRRGMVGTSDVNDANVLELEIPRLKVFYMHDGEEVELVPGHITRCEAAVEMKRVTSRRTFALDERISFTIDELYAIGFGCYLFAVDLVSKLPKIRG